ncbi:hypothetical protein [Kitasatospora sp. NBC_01300]|uniref:hypothetical protein n=1 Tax=Kitasatospora sp. NBC_01300 TaxID=2903574 RepID=UPI00352FBD4F|nr:hypothetical protein OG556_26025 [Kitasatospora sp. NBC_01300]
MPLFRRRSGEEAAQGGAGWRGRVRRAVGSAPVVAVAAPRLDPALGDESLRLMLAQAAAGDWAALGPALAAVGDGADLTGRVGAIADVPRVEEWTARALADRPEDTMALLLSGARHVTWAWEARTGARAKHVSEQQWKVFHERLDAAEEQLLEVAEREPSWLAPWYFLQISARGASLPAEVATCRFEAAVRRAPGHPASHRQRLQQLCAKWGGSHEEMHAFARASMLAAPEGSQLGELVVLAHLERWLDLPDGEDRAYLASAEVVADLQEAAFRSVLHPDFTPVRGWQGSFNAFAMAFSLAGQRKTARLLFEALDGAVTESPWHFLSGDPLKAFASHRDRCAY